MALTAIGSADAKTTIDNLEKVSVVFKCYQDLALAKEPLLAVVRHLWPVLVQLFKVWEATEGIVEELGRLIKHAIRKLDE